MQIIPLIVINLIEIVDKYIFSDSKETFEEYA